eukprot:1257353-Pleurochrysis_carterae.AAC.1
MLPMRLSSNIAAADAVADAISPSSKIETGSTTRFVSTQQVVWQRAYKRVGTRGIGERYFKFRASGRSSMPAKFARAALCCAGAEPAACGIAELEYGNPLDLRAIITHI